MRVKACAVRAKQPRLKVVMIKEGDNYITHIYRSRDCFRLDALAAISGRPLRHWQLLYPCPLQNRVER